MKRMLLAIGIMAVGVAIEASAQAATTTTTLNVSASVSTSCVVATTPISFGTYSGAQVNASGDVTVTCTNGTAYQVALDAGQNYVGSYDRRMSNGAGAFLNYNITSAGSGWWGDIGYGDTFPYAYPVPGTGTGSAQVLTVNAALQAGQSGVPAGAYSDVVNVTVWY